MKTSVFRVFWGLMIIASLWMGGFYAFLHRPMVVDHSYSYSDGAVVLTGGAGRIEAAIDLLGTQKVTRVLISGVNAQVRPVDLEQIVGISKEYLECCVDLGRAALNTQGNAQEAAQWVATHEYRRVTVVTADYHMPRAMLVLGQAMPDVVLLPHSVTAPASLWGRAKEYSKYLLTLIAIRFDIYQ